MPGRKATARSRFSYRRESFRQKLTVRMAAAMLVFELVVVVLLGSWVLMQFEKERNPDIDNFADATWVTIITIATVGYGDAYPVTGGGKVTIVVMLLTGVGLLTAFFSVRSARKVKDAERRAKGLDTNVKVSDHYVVCGWNQRTSHVLRRLTTELSPSRTPVVLLCEREENPSNDEYAFFIRGSSVSERDLKRAGIERARAALLMADETASGTGGDIDAKTVLAALTIKSLNPGIDMTAEAMETQNVHHLELAGVAEVLDSNSLVGEMLARSTMHFGLIGLMSQLATTDAGAGIHRIEVTAEMAGMPPAQLEDHLRDTLRMRPVALSTEGRVKPFDDEVKPRPGDVLLAVGCD